MPYSQKYTPLHAFSAILSAGIGLATERRRIENTYFRAILHKLVVFLLPYRCACESHFDSVYRMLQTEKKELLKQWSSFVSSSIFSEPLKISGYTFCLLQINGRSFSFFFPSLDKFFIRI